MYPVLFKIGSFPVFSYGILAVVGMVAAFAMNRRYARLLGMSPGTAEAMFLATVSAGIAGSKGLYILTRWDAVMNDPNASVWLLLSGGIWYGGVLAGMLAGVIFGWVRGISFWKILDVSAIPILVGGAVGRIGCLLSGCCHGAATDVPWAITYSNELAHRIHGSLPRGPVHPSPIYEFLLAMAIVVALDRVIVLKKPPVGVIGLLFVVTYGAGRSVLELFRGDAVRGTVLGALSTSQAIGLLTALAALTGLLIYMARMRRKEAAA